MNPRSKLIATLVLSLFMLMVLILNTILPTALAADGQFNTPFGVAIDSSGNVYVTDSGNNRVQKFKNSGTFIRTWGSEGSANGKFQFPEGIAVDKSGKVFVADVLNHRVQVFNNGGTFIGTWGSVGSANGQFNAPFGVAIDSSGNVYVADSGNNRVQKFKNNGIFIRTWGTFGTVNQTQTSSINPFSESESDTNIFQGLGGNIGMTTVLSKLNKY